MQIFAAMIVASADDVTLLLGTSEDHRRAQLIEWFNDHVEAGGLSDDAEPIPETATFPLISGSIDRWLGQSVVLDEAFV